MVLYMFELRDDERCYHTASMLPLQIYCRMVETRCQQAKDEMPGAHTILYLRMTVPFLQGDTVCKSDNA
jgi:hypothetical protein